MRLWSIHPRHLDPAGLVALWRESLLAQAVIGGRTRGYRHHPQLVRFLASSEPTAAIASYLRGVHAEAASRGYRFNERLIRGGETAIRIPETRGQILYEWAHLGAKLLRRAPAWYASMHVGVRPTAHPLFRVVAGGVRPWERPVERTVQGRRADG